MEYDGETQLYHTMFRYYNPRLGLWMTPDPVGMGAVDGSDPQSLNRYAYARNNPINYVDPLGLTPGCADKERGDGGNQGCGDGARSPFGLGPWGPNAWSGGVYMDGAFIPGDLVGLLIPDGSAIDCSTNLCGPQAVIGSNGNYIGFATPSYGVNGDISYSFTFDYYRSGVLIRDAGLAEILGLPTQAGLDFLQRRPELKTRPPEPEPSLRDSNDSGATLATKNEVSRCKGGTQTITATFYPDGLTLAPGSPDLTASGGVRLVGVPRHLFYQWSQSVTVSSDGSVLWRFSFAGNKAKPLSVKTPVTCYIPGQ